MDKKIVIFGANGQVGSSLYRLLNEKSTPITRNEVNFVDLESLKEFLANIEKPKAIINAAAYTAVDKAEEEREVAYNVNALCPKVIAEYCAKYNIPLIHYSTDYVYPGIGEKPWTEESTTSPLNIYGMTKLEGDQNIINSGANAVILRTSWVYTKEGKNFVNTILRLASEKEELNIIDDQIGAPTNAEDLARESLAILEQLFISSDKKGIYHICGRGTTNWYEFACAIIEYAKIKGYNIKVKIVNPIKSEDYKTPAKRPLNSRLNCEKLKKIFGIEMPNWRDSLKEVI